MKSFGKDIKRLEGLGVGGIVGAFAGGGLAGFALSKIDKELGITEELMDQVKLGWQKTVAFIAGTPLDIVEQAEQQAASEKKLGDVIRQSETHLKERALLLTQGAEAAWAFHLAQQGVNKSIIDAQRPLFQLNQQLERDAELRKLATHVNEAGLSPIDRQINEMRRAGHNEGDLGIVRILLERQQAQDEAGERARILAGMIVPGAGDIGKMFGDKAFEPGAVGALQKGSADEFSALQKLRRDLLKMDLNGDIEKNQMKQIEVEKEAKKVLDKIQQNTKDWGFAQANF
ncbi:hypothetical protein AYO44_03825 [Planctomycetaceae bacterium SCGC AG-212-F19]|nr:hypothetical protein AYO44_03825 [Planctomycetaceae bacterium SCGC AG-212-F19]